MRPIREFLSIALLVVGCAPSTNGSATAATAGPTATAYAGTFSATGSMTSTRFYHTATLLIDGRVLIAGGNQLPNGLGTTPVSAELYDPRTASFNPAGPMVTKRSFPRCSAPARRPRPHHGR